ncbi:MAG TPA: hypothetical protein PKA27_09710 [Fimbriimonadaceae bacterium]|nr:hypothetical protein [Fimbriimonadaceae bacterium]
MPEEDGQITDGSALVQMGSIGPIRQAYDEQQRRKQAFLAETAERRAHFERRLDELHAARQDAMAQASNFAGNLGLIYRAETNTFFRVVIVDDQHRVGPRPIFPSLPGASQVDSDRPSNDDTSETNEIVDETQTSESHLSEETLVTASQSEPPEPPKPPQLPERPSAPIPKDPDKKWEFATNLKSGIAWLGSIFVGWFVGFGLLSLTGLPYEREEDRLNLYLFSLIGISTVGVFKLVFDTMWYSVGRRNVLGSSDWRTTFLLTCLSIILIAVEAGLGGQALVTYSTKSSFQGEGSLTFGLAFLLATAITTPTVIYSGLVGYQKGQRSITQSDIEARLHELKMRDYDEARAEQTSLYDKEKAIWLAAKEREEELIQLVHDTEKARISDIHSAHADALAAYKEDGVRSGEAHELGIRERSARLEEYESFRNLPDFQALCKCMGLVDTINLRIREIKQEMTNDSISRGHGKKSAL